MWLMTSSVRTMTGTRYFSARSKARIVSSKHSRTLPGARTMMAWSPWVPQRACITSPWAGEVGMPVEGPMRWALMMTMGISQSEA